MSPNKTHQEDVRKPSIKNVILALLAQQDPWLSEYGDNFEEEAKLAEMLHGKGAQVKLFNLLFMLNTLKLDESQLAKPFDKQMALVGQPRVRNRLKFDLTCEHLRSSDKYKVWLLVISLLVMGLMTLCTIYVLVTCYFIFKFDTLMTNMRPILKRSRNGTTGAHVKLPCALKDEIVYGPAFSWPELIQVNEWLDFLGVANRSQLGVSFLATSIIVSGPLAFYLVPQMFAHYERDQIRLDSIACLYDPVRERRRIMAELLGVMQELAETFALSNRENSHLIQAHRLRLLTNPTAGRSTIQDRGPDQLGLSLAHLSRRLHKSTQKRRSRQLSNLEGVKFLELLDEIHRQALVRPIVVCSKWRADMQHFAKFLTLIFIFISSFFPQGSTHFSYMLELGVRTIERQKLDECVRLYGPNATLANPSLYLGDSNELFLDEQERDAHANFVSGSFGQLVKLILFHELRHFINLRVCLYDCALMVLITFLSAWSTFWAVIFIVSFLDKIAWLTQIKTQLQHCHELVGSHLKCTNWSQSKENQQNLELIKRLTVAYVNYELFRRQYKPFRLLTNFLVFQALSFAAGSFVGLYLIATSIETKFKLFSVYGTGSIIGFVNLYLVVASYSSKLLEYVLLSMTRLLALLANYPNLAAKPSLELWRRQLISEHEIRLFSSTRVFTMMISYREIISFNLQLFLIWLLLWRFFSLTR